MNVLSAPELLWLPAGSSHGHMETQGGSWEGICCLLLKCATTTPSLLPLGATPQSSAAGCILEMLTGVSYHLLRLLLLCAPRAGLSLAPVLQT